MSPISSPNPNADTPPPVAEAIDDITEALGRVMAGFATLKSLLLSNTNSNIADYDPKDAANKVEVGGLMKLSPRGVEICYRLFDSGKSRYAVANLMNISFGAATHRFAAWKKLGGVNRIKKPLS